MIRCLEEIIFGWFTIGPGGFPRVYVVRSNLHIFYVFWEFGRNLTAVGPSKPETFLKWLTRKQILVTSDLHKKVMQPKIQEITHCWKNENTSPNLWRRWQTLTSSEKPQHHQVGWKVKKERGQWVIIFVYRDDINFWRKFIKIWYKRNLYTWVEKWEGG